MNNLNRRTFLKLTGISLVLPKLLIANIVKNDSSIFRYHKPFELEAVYVFFRENHFKEYSLPLKYFDDSNAMNSDLVYQLWPKGTNPDWENNSMVYVSKNREKDGGWWTEQGFKDYFNKMIQKQYTNMEFHHSESGVAKWKEKLPLKYRLTFLK